MPTAEKKSSRSRGRMRAASCMQNTVRASRSSGLRLPKGSLWGTGGVRQMPGKLQGGAPRPHDQTRPPTFSSRALTGGGFSLCTGDSCYVQTSACGNRMQGKTICLNRGISHAASSVKRQLTGLTCELHRLWVRESLFKKGAHVRRPPSLPPQNCERLSLALPSATPSLGAAPWGEPGPKVGFV